MKPIETAADFYCIRRYLERVPYEDSILNMGNLVQWNTVYPIYYEEDEHHRYVIMMSQRTADGSWTAYVPLTEPVYYDVAIAQLKVHFQRLGQPFQMKWIPQQVFDLIRPYFGMNAVESTTDDESDYCYDAHALRTLAGKKMQKKRNHVNAFLNDYDGRYEFKIYTLSDRPEILNYLSQWKIKKASTNPLLEHEMHGIPAMLDYWEVENLKAGGLYLDNTLIGFVLVVETPRHMVQINVEKAEGDIRGAYPLLQQLTLQILAPQAILVNREDDGGVDYLRKAKQSMHPLWMMQKWTLKESSGR